MRQVTSTRARPMAAVGSTSTPVTRPLAPSQSGRQPMSAKPCAISSPPVRKRGAAPEVDDDRAQELAVRLQMRAHDLVGGEPAEVHGGRRRQGARIGGEEIAAGRQHVAPPARRRAGRAGRDAVAVERRKKRRALRLGALLPCRIADLRRRATVNVQAVLDGEVLEVAQPGIDAAQRVVGRGRARDTGLPRQAGALRRLDDQRGEAFAPPPVEAVGLRVFVDQALELARVAGKPAVNERRRQVPDGQPGDAALGLRRLARIADNERIDHRQRAGHDFREAFRGERDRLAGEPFERAMRAHVDERIGLGHVLQPKPEGDERVPRRQQRIVIVGAALRRAAAVGRQRDQKLAECLRAEAKAAVAHVGIVRRLAPGIAQPRDRGIRHARQQGFVFADAECCLIAAGGERIEQMTRRFRSAAHHVAGGGEIVEERDHARRHVEPDRVSGAPWCAGIIRHQHRDPPLAARQGAQAHERGDPVGDHRHAVRLGTARERGEGEPFVRRQRILEGDGAGEDAAVEFGSTMCIARSAAPSPRGAVPPGGASRGGAHDLQHGNAGRIERRRLADVAAGSECRRGDDDGGSELAQTRARKNSAASRSFKLVTKSAAGVRPRAPRAAHSASTGAVSAASSMAR